MLSKGQGRDSVESNLKMINWQFICAVSRHDKTLATQTFERIVEMLQCRPSNKVQGSSCAFDCCILQIGSCVAIGWGIGRFASNVEAAGKPAKLHFDISKH